MICTRAIDKNPTDDFQCMRSDRYRFNHKFISDYLKRESPSDPKDEFDDRNALYAM